MHGFKDHFSSHAAEYARFRPRYPDALYRYLRSIVPKRELAWDCGTGNGQAAVALAGIFQKVIATDASKDQIANATPHARVEYRVAPAEASGIDTDSIDLVTVAQALHWFDLDRFYAETNRVLKSGGVLAAWAYNLLKIAAPIDAIINRYYYEVVGSFWPPERRLVEEFDKLPFPTKELHAPTFEMAARWNLEKFVGYLKTWSATQRFIAANHSDPLRKIESELRSAWGDPTQIRRIAWPLALRVGRGGP